MIKEERITFWAKWCKYDKYSIVKHDDKIYIIPDENAKPSTYNPFDVKEELLKDILMLGKESIDFDDRKISDWRMVAEIKSKMESYQKKVLNFVTKYGLLGNFRYFPEDINFIEKDKIELLRGFHSDIKETVNYEKLYFWADKKIDWNHKMNVDDFQRNCGLDNNFEQTEGDRLNDFIFSKFYSESISEILDFAEQMYRFMTTMYTYFNDDNLEDDIKQIYINDIEGNRVDRINCGYHIRDGKLEFKWDYFSLRAAIDAILLINQTNLRNEVRLCKYCQKPFIAENLYDTPSCRNKANILKTRNRKKNNYSDEMFRI